MLDGVVLLWFLLTALSVAFVAVDIRRTPESPVLKWGFVLVTAYTGPFGAFFYVLGCREPLPGLHERYVASRWRQVLGSTMHCVAGDGVGILAGAVIGSALQLSPPWHLALEYVLGFGFGWSIFQALFMRDMAGGSFTRALRQTFLSEFLSMNALMGGMVLIKSLMMANFPGSESPRGAAFWFVMSVALLGGAVVAYPMNWWLVSHHLKHGMMTVRKPAAGESMKPGAPVAAMDTKAMEQMAADHKETAPMAMGQMEMPMDKPTDHKMTPGAPAATLPSGVLAGMSALSIAIFGVGIALSVILAGRI
jgi:Domain of unknown function (DUF4396)